MVLKEKAQPFLFGEKLYCVGDLVYANHGCVYEGLFGHIIEIRDGEDKLTCSSEPEMVCTFNKPVLPDVIHCLERRISRRERQPKMLHEIELSNVILSPEEVTVIEDENPECFDVGCFRLNIEWIIDGNKSSFALLFSDYLTARKRFMDMLETEITSGCIDAWSRCDEFFVNCDKEWFECWLVGQCDSNHYRIALDHECLRLTGDTVQAIGQLYLDQQFRKDFALRISEGEATNRFSEDMQHQISEDLCFPYYVRKAIKECPSLKEAYQEVLDVAARYMMIHYAERANRPPCYQAKYDALDSACEGNGSNKCKVCLHCESREGGESNE